MKLREFRALCGVFLRPQGCYKCITLYLYRCRYAPQVWGNQEPQCGGSGGIFFMTYILKELTKGRSGGSPIRLKDSTKNVIET